MSPASTRRLGISKNTVKDYIKKAEEKNLSPPELLEKGTPELEGMFREGYINTLNKEIPVIALNTGTWID